MPTNHALLRTRSFHAVRSILIIFAFFIQHLGWSQSATWQIGAGGNGHYYELIAVPGGITWNNASVSATNRGGYLATITSSSENAFVHGVASQNTNAWYISGSTTWYGPWLGGVQPAGSVEPAGGWRWVTEEPLAYSNWASVQPNNSGGAEDRIQFVGATLATAATWNDLAQTNIAFVRGYVVEHETRPFLSISASDTEVDVFWKSRTNTLYTVQHNATLETNTWVNWLTHVAGNGGTNRVTDEAPSEKAHRYYRVKIE